MLKEIEVTGFKSLKHLTFPCAKLNLLTGLNGSGKSSLIQLILLLSQVIRVRGSDSELELVEKKIDLGTQRDLFYAYTGETYANRKIPVRFVMSATKQDVLRKVAGSQALQKAADRYFGSSSPDNLAQVPISGVLTCTDPQKNTVEWHPLDNPIPPRQRGDTHDVKIRRFLLSAVLSFNRMAYLSANRIGPTRIHHYEKIDKPTAGSTGEKAASTLLDFGAAPIVNPDLFYETCTSPCLLDQINAWLDIISPGAKITVKLVEEVGMVLLSVGFSEDKDAHWFLPRDDIPFFPRNIPLFRPQNVGAGISCVLSVLLEILVSKPGEILIIEDPESQLHPRGQVEIGKLLARAAESGVQVFVETHSDHILNGIRVATKQGMIAPEDVNVAFFSRAGHESPDFGQEFYSEMQRIEIDKNGALVRPPEGFMDEWGLQLRELLRR